VFSIKISLFFLHDKIVSDGPKIVNEKELESLRSYLVKGVFVARKFNEHRYIVNVNVHIEEELRRLKLEGAKNLMPRAYEALDCDEHVVVREFFARIGDEPYKTSWNPSVWMQTLKQGSYMDTVSINNSMLDSMVYRGMIEFEACGTYSLSSKFLDRVLKHDSIHMSKVKTMLDCADDDLLTSFMKTYMYDLKGKKFVKRECLNPIGFVV